MANTIKWVIYTIKETQVTQHKKNCFALLL